MPPKDDLMMGLDGQDRRDMREKLRRQAAQKDQAAFRPSKVKVKGI